MLGSLSTQLQISFAHTSKAEINFSSFLDPFLSQIYTLYAFSNNPREVVSQKLSILFVLNRLESVFRAYFSISTTWGKFVSNFGTFSWALPFVDFFSSRELTFVYFLQFWLISLIFAHFWIFLQMADDIPYGGGSPYAKDEPEIIPLPPWIRPFDPEEYDPQEHILPPSTFHHFTNFARQALADLLLREPESHLSHHTHEVRTSL